MYRKQNIDMTRYRGLSTDTKPDADFGSTFHEMDTGDIYRFDGSEWQKCGSLAGTDPSIYMSMWGARGNTKKAWALSALAGGHSDPGILKTVTGNPISVSDALAARIQSLSVSLSPIQAGSGDPYPAGGGKNLHRPYAYSGNAGGAVAMTYSDDGSVTINGTASAKAGIPTILTATQKGYVYTLSAGTYTISITGQTTNIYIEVYDAATSKQLATSSSPTFTLTENKTVLFRCAVRNGITYDNQKVYMQLERGSSATFFTPYSNICPISGWTGANVYHSGADTSDATTYSITFPSEAGTVYGGTLDVTNGKLTVNWAKIVLNGTQQISRENWKPQANSVGWIYPYDLTRNIVGTGAVLQNIKCDTLPSMPFNSLQSINGPGIALASNQTYGISVMYPNTTLTTASAINAFLAEHPIDVVYELATPQTITLDPATLSTLKGDNNVWSDGDEISMTYKAAAA